MGHVYALEIEWGGIGSGDPNLPTLVGPFSRRIEAEEWAALNIPEGRSLVRILALPYEATQ